MESKSSVDITTALHEVAQGHPDASERLLQLVHRELHGIAAAYMRRERPDHTLQPTALVNEAFIRLFGSRETNFANRAHFFAAASQAIRRILVEHARAHRAQKRGGGVHRVELSDQIDGASTPHSLDVLALHEALDGLAVHSARQARVVELRFFGGLSVDETAQVLSISTRQVEADWAFARAWLRREIGVL